MAEAPALVWLRRDLRLADNPALRAAIGAKRPLLFLYILDDETTGRWKMGAASRWWLHKSLEALKREIEAVGARLVLRRGRAKTVLPRVVSETGAGAVYWNRTYEPNAIERDREIMRGLAKNGVEAENANGGLLIEPWEVKTKSGEPYKVFTPFWRACQRLRRGRGPMAAPKTLNGFGGDVASEALSSWKLAPQRPNWAKGFEPLWKPGEAGARAALTRFVDTRLSGYAEARDQIGEDGTSRLSPHLHFGEVSPVQVRAAVEAAATHKPALARHVEKFMAELGWREFSHNLLFHWPTLPEQNWRSAFDTFPWRDDEAGFTAWKRGRTGYPLVDAAMRELWATGYMHNRARMIAASFLIKHLLIDWRKGERWFWDTLLDADLASNAASWQWVAGSGADAAPFFRIFNPIVQGERFDADGAYVRRWAPELARLPNSVLHKPWNADAVTLRDAGVTLGRDYPFPIVDHDKARKRALAAYKTIQSK